jgi:hypothetical protein
VNCESIQHAIVPAAAKDHAYGGPWPSLTAAALDGGWDSEGRTEERRIGRTEELHACGGFGVGGIGPKDIAVHADSG